MTPTAYRLARAALEAACVVLAIIVARRSREARPVAWALSCLAAIDLVRLAPLPAWVDVALWCAWPGVPAALAWRAWSGRADGARETAGLHLEQPPSEDDPGAGGAGLGRLEGGIRWCAASGPVVGGRREEPSLGLDGDRSGNASHARSLPPWAAVAALFLAYPLALYLAPVHWPAYPWAWSWARRLPYLASPALCVLAWALRKDEGPETGTGEASSAVARSGPSESGLVATRSRPSSPPPPTVPVSGVGTSRPPGLKSDAEATPSRRLAQAVAATLALSGGLDVAVGALADDPVPWEVAWTTSAATWGLVAGILAAWLLRSPARPST